MKSWTEVNMRPKASSQKKNRAGRIAVPTADVDSEFYDADGPIDESDIDDSNDEPYDPHSSGAGGTIQAAVFGIIKAMVGPAILYLPHSFADAGYVFALFALFVCVVMYLYSSRRLLETWHYVRSKKITVDATSNTRTTSTSGSDGSNEVEMVTFMKDPNNKTSDANSSSLSRSDHTNTSVELGGSSSSLKKDIDASVIGNNNGSGSTSSSRSTNISYPQLAKMAYNDIGESIVRTGITLMQLGVCLTYFIFVPHNLSKSIYTLFKIHVPMWICLIAMVIVEIPLSSIRNIRKLVHTNVLANALIAFGLISCLYLALTMTNDDEQSGDGFAIDGDTDEDASSNPQLMLDVNMNSALEVGEGVDTNTVRGDNRILTRIMEEISSRTTTDPNPESKPLGAWNDKWYLFIGTSVLLFEGSITLCLPLQAALQGQEAIQKFPTVYIQTISSIVVFYSFFGMTCWIAFGDDVNTVLTTSLPDGILATMVQLAYSVAVIFTFPLQIFPALEIIVQFVEQKLSASNNLGRMEASTSSITIGVELSREQRVWVVSIVIVVLSIIAIVEMDNLGRVVSLMGSLLGVPLAFIFPPLIHNKIVPTAPKSMNLAVASAGFLAMIGATLTTLATWSEGGE